MKSIIQTDTDRCFYKDCWNTPTDWHHLCGGPDRKWSEKYGLKIHVCHECHMKIHNGKESRDRMDALHKLAQEKFEAIYSHEEWMERFRKNYL